MLDLFFDQVPLPGHLIVLGIVMQIEIGVIFSLKYSYVFSIIQDVKVEAIFCLSKSFQIYYHEITLIFT